MHWKLDSLSCERIWGDGMSKILMIQFSELNASQSKPSKYTTHSGKRQK